MAAFVRPMSALRPLLARRPGPASLVLWALLGAGAAHAQQAARTDQVLWRNARGQLNTLNGTVKENTLTQVVIASGSSERKISTLDVERVEFGDVPPSFADGLAYLEHADFENAAAKFSLAASDAAARAVVRARARLEAARAWLRRGAVDPLAFESARKECELFLSEHADNRELPEARLLLGRALRLSGDAPRAAETYAALYREASGAQPTPGYPPAISFQAGLFAAEAYLAGNDAAHARETYLGLDAALTTALAALDEKDPRRATLLAIQSEARLGEGFCLLASGSVSQAKTFFQGQLSGASGSATRRFGAQLGLGEALLAEGNAAAARLELALVSAIDFTDKDRVARALVGLAQCATKLNYSSARNDARLWLETVRTQYGDTPAVLRAQELLKTL
jgi:TolA-binding protein